jgi:hypothetical protein
MKKNKRPAEGSFVSAPSFLISCCSSSWISRWTSSPAAAKKNRRSGKFVVRRASKKMKKKINRSAEGTIVSASFPSIYCCSFSCFYCFFLFFVLLCSSLFFSLLFRFFLFSSRFRFQSLALNLYTRGTRGSASDFQQLPLLGADNVLDRCWGE